MFVFLGFGQNLYNWLESVILEFYFSFLLSNRYSCHELIQIAIVQLRLNFSNLIIITHKNSEIKNYQSFDEIPAMLFFEKNLRVGKKPVNRTKLNSRRWWAHDCPFCTLEKTTCSWRCCTLGHFRLQRCWWRALLWLCSWMVSIQSHMVITYLSPKVVVINGKKLWSFLAERSQLKLNITSICAEFSLCSLSIVASDTRNFWILFCCNWW